MTSPAPPDTHRPGEKELRLALVCYGGISLAVYMHGITKEVWHLARASRHVHEPVDDAPLTGSAAVYAALLRELAEVDGARLRILPDIIAGASAGGINGIFLAQAIGAGQSLDPLTDLWLDRADVEALIGADAAPHSRFSKAWAMPLAWMAAGRSADDLDALDPGTRDEVRAKLSHFVRSRWFEPPFSGPGFTAMLLDAFDAMAAAPRGPRLLPAGQPLDLFVTVTDFGGHPERLTLHSPTEVMETEHRLVFRFSDSVGAADGFAHAAELTFAARATSSFPGAFPPFTVAELDDVLTGRGRDWPGRTAFLQRILPRQAAVGAAEQAVLIDGSVLANAPFRPAIDALQERPARRRVDRRFVYVDPSPGHKFSLGRSGAGQEVPGFFQTILGAVTELPRQQPIRDNLEAIAGRSARIERMRAILLALRPEVDAQVEALFGRTFFLDRPTPARLVSWRRRAQQAATTQAGYAYAGYAHLKLAGVVASITELLHRVGDDPGPQRWSRIRDRIDAALIARGQDERGSASSDATIAFLRTFDIGFRIRRLRILSRRLSEIEADHADATLEPIREAIYQSLSAYLTGKLARTHEPLRPAVRGLSGDAGPLLDRLGTSLDLTRRDAETDARLAAALALLPREPRRAMLLAYLGFPYADVATLPLLQGEGIDEYDPIKVDRISPDDARSIRGGGAEATLKGIQFNNFGAFFSRAYRENDYLWGRLHGAERMIDIAVSTVSAPTTMRPGRVAAIKRQAFLAILDEEAPRLTAVASLIASLRREIG